MQSVFIFDGFLKLIICCYSKVLSVVIIIIVSTINYTALTFAIWKLPGLAGGNKKSDESVTSICCNVIHMYIFFKFFVVMLCSLIFSLVVFPHYLVVTLLGWWFNSLLHNVHFGEQFVDHWRWILWSYIWECWVFEFFDHSDVPNTAQAYMHSSSMWRHGCYDLDMHCLGRVYI